MRENDRGTRASKKIVSTLAIITTALFVIVVIALKIANIKIVDFNGHKEITNNCIEYINNTFNNYTVTFVENGNTELLSFKNLGVYSEISDSGKDYIDNHFIVDVNKVLIHFNSEELESKLAELNNNRLEHKYASIKKGEKYFILEEETIGNKLNTKKIVKELQEILDINSSLNKSYNSNITINLENYKYSFDDTKTRQSELEKELEKIENTYVEYTNGYKLELKDLYDYLIIEDNTILLDSSRKVEYKEYIDNKIEINLLDYDTVGKEIDFTTSTGKTIKVSGGTYGNIFDSDLETEYILSVFEEYTNETNREPIYKKEMSHKLKDNYIEVSIQDQHVWIYKNCELMLESDTVTGTKGRHDTPLGVYYITEMVDGKYLRGPGYVTWVNKWMRITDRGHGLHDATWRSKFGNKIYTYDGSHGCINLPKKVAYELFEIAEKGMPVIIY